VNVASRFSLERRGGTRSIACVPVMPGIFFEPSDRRAFLKTAILGGTALAVNGCRSSVPRASTSPRRDPTLHLALISDTHVPGDRVSGSRGFNPWENLKRTVPEIAAVRPQAVIHNGDAARLEGLVPDYAEVRTLLQPIAAFAPIYIGLGNHDDRANFKKVFTSTGGRPANVKDKHILVIDEEALRFIMLDSLLYTNKVAGLLGKEQRAWLTEFLATTVDKPIVIFVHHTLGDGDGDLLDARHLFEIIKPHPQVKAIFYGHSHQWSITERQGVKLINLPAVGYNFADKEPVGWVDARFNSKGVDLTLRAFAGNTIDNLKIHQIRWA
jgi:Icc protein